MNEQQAIDAADAYNDSQEAMAQDYLLREEFLRERAARRSAKKCLMLTATNLSRSKNYSLV